MASLSNTAFQQSFDEIGATEAGCAAYLNLARDESMEVANDPRFFSSNVMDKRLSAFKSISIVSTLMFATSVKLVFKLKKNQNFAKLDPYVGSIAWWQFGTFCLALAVSFMCLLSLYIIAHQLFYTYRLMTAGPTGFEQACVFYLTRVITMWRHLAIKCLFNGLLCFMVLIGAQLFIQFYIDAEKSVKKPDIGWLANSLDGASVNNTKFIHSIEKHAKHKLDMRFHTCLGYVGLIVCTLFSLFLWKIRKHHLKVFQDNYRAHKPEIASLEATMRAMSQRSSHRGTAFLDT
jgi:hypothetical protein